MQALFQQAKMFTKKDVVNRIKIDYSTPKQRENKDTDCLKQL